MAVQLADQFRHYTAAQLARAYTVAGTSTITTGAYGPDGTPGLRFAGTYTDYLRRENLAGDSTCIQLFDFRLSADPPVENALAAVGIGATGHAHLNLTTSRTFTIRGGTESGTLLGTSAYALPLNTHVRLAWKVIIANSGSSRLQIWEWTTGRWVLQETLDVTGDTFNAGASSWSACGIGPVCDGNNDFANYVAIDGSGPGLRAALGSDYQLDTLWANARVASALTDWSLSTGASIAALLDDVTPDDDTTYCEESSVNGQVSTAVDLLPYPRSVIGAESFACAKLTAGTPTLQTVAYDGTARLGTAVAATAGYSYLRHAYSVMPNGAAFSSAADFDALQWGAKLASTGTARLTQVAVVVVQAVGSRGNILGGYGHTVSGANDLLIGQQNTVEGDNAQAHGTQMSVQGDRTVGINLTTTPRTLAADGTFAVWADDIQFNGAAITTVSALDDLTDVALGSPLANGDLLTYDTGSGLWISAAPAAPVGGTGNVTDTTAFGSEPSGSPAPEAGDLDLYTDSFYVSRYSGSAWVPWGPLYPMTDPALAAPTTWVNQGGASVNAAQGGIYLEAPATAPYALRARVKTAPSTPYTITAAFLANVNPSSAVTACNFGLCFRQSSDGKLHTLSVWPSTSGAIGAFTSTKFTSPTSLSNHYLQANGAVGIFTLYWLQISDNGTNRVCRLSSNGQFWTILDAQTRTDFLTADEVGFFVNAPDTTYAAGVLLLSWRET